MLFPPLFFSCRTLYMLKLLEYNKHQLNQLTAMGNVNAGKMNGEGPAEMPEDIQFPLQSVAEVQHFEEWLREPANSSQKRNLV